MYRLHDCMGCDESPKLRSEEREIVENISVKETLVPTLLYIHHATRHAGFIHIANVTYRQQR